MSQVMIKEVTKKDVPHIQAIMKKYIVDFYKQPEPNDENLTHLIEYLLDHPSHGIQFVAEQGDRIVGFATVYFTFSTLSVKKAAILNDLFVEPDVRGQNIGEKLFVKALDYIRKNDFAYMSWETAKDNEVAQRLYHKVGGKRSDWLHYEMK